MGEKMSMQCIFSIPPNRFWPFWPKIVKNKNGSKMGTVPDMAKKLSKVVFGVDINKIYQSGQNLRGSLRNFPNIV